jgi:hypothetical protein
MGGADSSLLESLVAKEWMKRKNIDSGNKYKIWNVERMAGGSNTDSDGKFDRTGVTKWALLPEVRTQIEQLGAKTAQRQMSITFDDDAAKNTMTNTESMRMMASRWTKMMRNRLVSNLGQMRAGAPPTEFMLDEEKYDCDKYRAAMAKEQEDTRLEERLRYQPKLSPETRALELEQRYQMCMKIRKASVRMVNAKIMGDKVSSGGTEDERIDEWRTRLNIAAIDAVGVDVQSLPKPSYANLTREDLTSLLPEHEVGGLKLRRIQRMSNAQQLQSYNNNLELAAVGMKEVAMRTQNVVDRSDEIRKKKIQPGTRNAIELNSITPVMRRELASTSFEASAVMKKGNESPERNLEDTPAELTITKK